MIRRLALLLALLVLGAVAVAGCGEDEKDAYIDAYKPQNDRLLAMGKTLGRGLQRADRKSNKALSEQFAAYALQLEDIGKDIRSLNTPSDLKDESDDLTTQIDATVKHLEEISGAAANNDPQGAAAATVELASSSRTLNSAQNKLAKATGADTGGR